MNNEFTEASQDSIDFAQIFAVLLRWTWLFALLAALGAGVAYEYSRRQTPIYQASTNILVSRSNQREVADISQSLNITQLVETYSQMLTMTEFLDIVSQKEQYAVSADNITVRALPNTQVIELKVEDPDPARAARIVDAMVVVLIEQNENLQAGRYNEAEAALTAQVRNAEEKISESQVKLEQAKLAELNKQVVEVQANINLTVETVKALTLELDRLDDMNWTTAHFLLYSTRNNLARQQAVLDQLVADQSKANELLSSERALADENYANLLKGQIDLYTKKIADSTLLIEQMQAEIAFLTPLDGADEFDSTVLRKENELATQQALLKSYQQLYAELLSSEEGTRTTNEMQNLQKDLDLYQKIYVDLLSQLEGVRKEKLQNTPTVEQVSPAIAGTLPVKPRVMLNTLLGALAGFILAAAFVLIRESADSTIKGSEDVKKILGTRVVGYITDIKGEVEGQGTYSARFPRSPTAEAFRSLRAHLGFTKSEFPIKTIMVTSSGPSEGKTTIAANLATVLAHSGRKVVLVDTDMRRPRVHRYIGLPNEAGLADLEEVSDISKLLDYIHWLDAPRGLGVLTSGGIPDNPADLLSSDQMRAFIKLLSEKFDLVVLDAPPMLVSDPHVLLGLADGLLLAMVPGKTRLETVRSIGEVVQRTGINLLGVVFNRVKRGRRWRYGRSGYGGDYYAYPYYYASEYYYAENPETGKREKRKKKSSREEAPAEQK